MPFQCPDCFTSNSLEIAASIELPADSRSDEIVLQLVACSACGFQALAVYEESRRGALDSESWDHTGYRVEVGELGSVRAAILRCPRPNQAGCPCPTHRDLGRTDAQGLWIGPGFLRQGEAFALILAPGEAG
jgi:hypothetical protein